jgi:hypothetical protein
MRNASFAASDLGDADLRGPDLRVEQSDVAGD